jgi:ketosteroid isomerase-like protein
MSSPEQHLARVQKLFSSFAAGDGPGIAAGFDQGTEWFPLAGVLPGSYVGPAGIMSLFARMREETDGTFKSIPVSMAANDDCVFVEANIRGARAGKHLDIPMLMVFHFAGDALVDVRLHANDYPAFAAFWS